MNWQDNETVAGQGRIKECVETKSAGKEIGSSLPEKSSHGEYAFTHDQDDEKGFEKRIRPKWIFRQEFLRTLVKCVLFAHLRWVCKPEASESFF